MFPTHRLFLHRDRLRVGPAVLAPATVLPLSQFTQTRLTCFLRHSIRGTFLDGRVTVAGEWEKKPTARRAPEKTEYVAFQFGALFYANAQSSLVFLREAFPDGEADSVRVLA